MNLDALVSTYLQVKADLLRDQEFAGMVGWQESVAVDRVTVRTFTMEAGWVIVNSGMRFTVAQGIWRGLRRAFDDFNDMQALVEHRPYYRARALGALHYAGKVDAMLEIAGVALQLGDVALRERIVAGGVDWLETLPFIGPVTRYHLAKNVGLDVSKPDRHLVRIAACAGWPSPASMVEALSQATGDRRAVVDLVVWRHAERAGSDAAALDVWRDVGRGEVAQ